MVPVVPVTILAFIKLGLYRAVIRYISIRALRAVVLGVFASTAALVLADRALELTLPVPVPIIYALLLFLSVGGLRFAARAVLLRSDRAGRKPVLIYGAGRSGRQLVSALGQGSDYLPVAFVDDDRRLAGSDVAGLPVHPPGAIGELIRLTGARTVLLAMPNIDRARLRAIVARLEKLPVSVQAVPGMAEIVSGRPLPRSVRGIRPEDLLGRDPIAPDEAAMRRHIAGKVVLVTGAAGSIGSELCRQIVTRAPARLVMLDVAETPLYELEQTISTLQAGTGQPRVPVVPVLGSIQDRGRLQAVLGAYGVQTVYHAAAYKHVPLVEENVVEGLLNNVFGTRTLVRAAAAARVENFILISSDKAVRPTSVMGASKRLAELICQAEARKSGPTVFSMVRFGNVVGSSGSVIPRFDAQIAAGGPVTVTHRDMTRYFMTISEAAQLVIQAGVMARGGDVFLLDMGEPVRILDLARTMIRLHGFVPRECAPGEVLPPDPDAIDIHIVGLRKGEKLFEELLIGSDPVGTDHPRIMTAREVALDAAALDPLLDRLWQACLDYDLTGIKAILHEAPLGFVAPEPVLSDLTWLAMQGAATGEVQGERGGSTPAPVRSPMAGPTAPRRGTLH